MYQNYSIKVTKKLVAISKTVLQKQILYAITKWWCTGWQNVIPEKNYFDICTIIYTVTQKAIFVIITIVNKEAREETNKVEN